MRETPPGAIHQTERGFVLFFALLILVILTLLGVAAMMTSTAEIKIAGNLKTATRSLYIAEGGIEAITVELQNSSTANFASTSAVVNIQDHTIGTAPTTTLTNPVNWVGTGNGWYIDESRATALTAANATWPIYKSITVGDGEALITLKRPSWFTSTPVQINFPQAVSRALVPSPRFITTNLEVEFGNNLLFFQTFTQGDGSTYITSSNFTSGTIYIGSSEKDSGISTAAGMITGVCTNNNSNKALIIYRYNTSSSRWEIVGEPSINSTTKTFALGGGQGWRYTPFSGGNGEEPVVTLVGSDYVPTASGSLTLSTGQRYKVELKKTSDLTLSDNNPPGDTGSGRRWTSNNYDDF